MNSTMETPGFAEMVMQDATLANKLKEDWQNVEEVEPGVRLKYGVQGGKVFAFMEQDDMSDILAYCRKAREAEIENPKMVRSTENPMYTMWVMPKILRFELMSRGYPVDEMVNNGELNDINKIIEREYPEFKTTNMKLNYS